MPSPLLPKNRHMGRAAGTDCLTYILSYRYLIAHARTNQVKDAIEVSPRQSGPAGTEMAKQSRN